MKHYEDFYNEAKQYPEILRRYEEKGEVFTDPNFIPTNEAKEAKVEFDDENHTWQRIDKFYKAPLFKKKCITEDAIQQGELGTCYFIASLSRIARQPELVELLFDTRTQNLVKNDTIENQDTINLKCGAVVVYFHVFGKRTPVLIDTLIPFQRGTRVPRFSHPSDINFSPWFCLVEKAYAKLHGSYSAIISGKLSQAIYHLFGYYPCYKNIDEILQKRKDKLKSKKKSESSKTLSIDDDFDENEYLFSLLMKWQYQNAVLGADILLDKLRKGVTEDDIKDNGLVSSHAYLIVKVRREEGKNFICLRNPWGNHEWLGDWSDTSILWTSQLKRALGVHRGNNGTFWMIAEDFFRYFSSFDIAKPVDPEYHNKSITCKLLPGPNDGYDILSKEADLSHHQTFVFRLKNVHVKTSNDHKENSNKLNVNSSIPTVNDLKVYITIEKRSPFIERNSEDGSEEEQDPKYQVFIFYSNGEKIGEKIPGSYNGIRTNCGFYRFTIHVRKNSPFVIVFQRNDKRDYTEECYVRFSCKYDFDLFDYDNPTVLSKEDKNIGILFDNESKRYSNISRKIVSKEIQGEFVRGYEETDISENNNTFYKELRLNVDQDTSTGYYEYSISDDSSSHRTQLRRNQRDLTSLLNETKRQIQESRNEIASIFTDTKQQTMETKNEISTLLNETKEQTIESKDEISTLLSDTKEQVKETKDEIASIVEDAQKQPQETKEVPSIIQIDEDELRSPLTNFIYQPKSKQPQQYAESQSHTESQSCQQSNSQPPQLIDQQLQQIHPLLQQTKPFLDPVKINTEDDLFSERSSQRFNYRKIPGDQIQQSQSHTESQSPQSAEQQQQQNQLPLQQNPLLGSITIDTNDEQFTEKSSQQFNYRKIPGGQIQQSQSHTESQSPQSTGHQIQPSLQQKPFFDPTVIDTEDELFSERSSQKFNYRKIPGDQIQQSQSHTESQSPQTIEQQQQQQQTQPLLHPMKQLLDPAKIDTEEIELFSERSSQKFYYQKIPGDHTQDQVDYIIEQAEKNDPVALYKLGLMHSKGQEVEKNQAKAIELFEKAAKLGNPDAQYALGLLYYNGNGVPQNKQRAFELFTQSANKGNQYAQAKLGNMYSSGDVVELNYQKALDYYTKSASQNNAEAQVNLGVMYDQGQGVEVNKKKAYQLYTQSAMNGSPNALFNLGYMNETGVYGFIPRDIPKAATFYQQAAERGITQAMVNLGNLYLEDEENFSADWNKAAELFKQAADQNDSNAMLHLGMMYSHGQIPPGVNKQKAAELLTKAAELNNPSAQFNLGYLYSKGEGVEKDPKKAVYYYQKAADQNVTKAKFNLGVLLFRGAEGVPQNKPKAAELFEQVSDKNSKALFNLAIMHENGDGVEKDIEKAIYYYEKAAELNNKDALLNLACIYDQGIYHIPQDKEKAFNYYQQASNLGSDKAQTNLGLMYMKGEGCNIDKEKAKKYFKKAADNGNPQANLNYAILLDEGSLSDRENAKIYYQESADKGIPEAMLILARKHMQDGNFHDAKKYYQMAANKGNHQAQLELGQFTLNSEESFEKELNNRDVRSVVTDSISNEFKQHNQNSDPSLMIYNNDEPENLYPISSEPPNESNDNQYPTEEPNVEIIENQYPKEEPEDEKIGNLYNALENRVKALHNQSNKEPFNDVKSTLDEVNDLLVEKQLSDQISDYSERNKAMKNATNESADLISKYENKNPAKSSLPPLFKNNSNEVDQLSDNFESIEEDNPDYEEAGEISTLKQEVQLLTTQLNRVEMEIKEESNRSSGSTKKIQSPKEMSTTEILRRYCLPPRVKRNKIWNLQKRAEEGDPQSQYLLGACYARGEEVPKNREKALEYYLMAANNGNADGQYAAACCYFYGKGTTVNQTKAAKLFSLAAEQGHPKAQFALGHIFEFGKCGFDKNYEVALKWYKKAADNGHQAATRRILDESS